jgi:hypothetical protein
MAIPEDYAKALARAKNGIATATFGNNGVGTAADSIANDNRARTDLGYNTAELKKAQDIMNARKAAGLDTTAQNNYITKLTGFQSALQPKDEKVASSANVTAAAGPSSTDYINQIYAGNYASQMQALQKARDTALQGLNGVETTAKQGAYANRNAADVVNAQNVQKLREAMANMGLSSSGDSITGQIGLATARQGAMNDINQGEQNTLKDVSERRALINNNAAGDESALINQLNAAKANMLLNQFNADRSYGLDVAGLTGYLGNQRTMQGQQFDYNQATDQRNFDYNKSVDDRNFNYQQARDAIGDERYKEEFDEDMRRFGLNYALDRQVQLGNLSINQAQLALSRSNSAADNARADKALAWQMDPNNPDNQRSSGSGGSGGGAKYDFRTDPEFTKEIAFISSNPDRALTEIQNNAQELIQTYGYDGYQELIKEATRKR